MKKILSLLLVLALTLAVTAASAAAPEAGSITVTQKNIRGDNTFVPGALNEAFITPFYADGIIEGRENYPASFLRFSVPESYTLGEFNYDTFVVYNYDNLYAFAYYMYDSRSFEVFLEDVEADNVVADGSDGKLAIYVEPDRNRARALYSVKDLFGKSAKLEVQFYDYAREMKRDDLVKMVSDEIARVTTSMVFEELNNYWSQGAFASVELCADNDPVSVVVDCKDLTITRLDLERLQTKTCVDDSAKTTEIEVNTYSYAHSQETAKDVTLKDGTSCKVYSSEYISYAGFELIKDGKYGTVYLTIKIDCVPDEFMDLLEAAYARLSITKE